MRYRVRITERIISHITIDAPSAREAEEQADHIYEHNVHNTQYDPEMSGVTCETLKEVI